MSADNSTAVQSCLDRIRGGEPGARDELLAITRARLLAMIRGLIARFPGLRRWEQSDDVLHNVQVRLLRLLAQAPVATALDYFCLAAKNMRWELTDLHRRHYGRQQDGAVYVTPPTHSADRGAGLAAAPDGGDDPTVLAELAELHDLVAALPEDERQVVDLHWYHGLTHLEAAALLGVCERTVKRRWLAARARLATRLGGCEPG